MDLLLPILLVIIGVAFMAAEVYLVPGFNVVGILGFLVIVFAVGLMFSTAGMIAGWLTLFGTMGLVGALGWVVWRSGAWERFILASSITRDVEEDDKLQENRARYLGKTGTAVSPLRPTGVAEIGDERLEVTTEGGFIASGSVVRVVAMDRRRLFVRLAEAIPGPSEVETPASPQQKTERP